VILTLATLQPDSSETLLCQQLQMTNGQLRHIWHGFNGKSHLVIDSDELSSGMNQVLVREHLWSYHLHYHQVQCPLLGTLAMHLWFLPCIPNRVLRLQWAFIVRLVLRVELVAST